MKNNNRSAFKTRGLKKTVQELLDEIKELYKADNIPWVIGYSGGKDSTASLELVWMALKELAEGERTKPIYVISTDTLVENPIVSAWVNKSLLQMEEVSSAQGLPIKPHLLTPKVEDSFWVNLIGKGYPAPRPKFRWCTERLKIRPSNQFIKDVVKKSGEAILVLGTRKAESAVRARTIEKHSKFMIRERLRPNSTLPNCLIYSPIEDWSNDDVWMFLMQVKNPWGFNNKELLTMYKGASEGGECPLVVDSTTPSCGDSRFGCWVCTLVDKDRSMSAMIQNDVEKEWMLPLLELRNDLDQPDHQRRDFRRMSGIVQINRNSQEPIPGPYTQEWREKWLRKLLKAQEYVRANGPKEVSDIELITLDELHEIRRIWLMEKHELEDSLPKIYETQTGITFPGKRLHDAFAFDSDAIDELKKLCSADYELFALSRELLGIEQSFNTQARRSGLFVALEKSLRKHFYANKEDAQDRALRKLEDLKRLDDSNESSDVSRKHKASAA